MKLLHTTMWLGSIEEELTGEALTPVGLTLTADGRLHMVMLLPSTTSFLTMVKNIIMPPQLPLLLFVP
jgi:hypothetical protein